MDMKTYCLFALPVMVAILQSSSVGMSDNLPTVDASDDRGNDISVDRINVLDHGVKGVGCAHDDAPAIRSIFSGAIERKIVFFPPNRIYCIKTNIEAGYPAFNRSGIIVSQKSNFHVIAKGAYFKTDGSIPLTTAFTFDRVSNWSWKGGAFVGDRSGLPATAENVAIALVNVQRFRISDILFTGYGGLGAAFAGDWIVSGELSRLAMRGVGICFDFAFLKDVTIKDVVAKGADTQGRAGPRQMGEKCFSNIHDGPLASHNYTGIHIPQTDNVTLENLDISNFRTGISVSSGMNYRFIKNKIHNNHGDKTPGIGYYFHYTRGGIFSSVGYPVKKVDIFGGSIINNGSKSKGFGLLIDAGNIKNKDVMENFYIDGVKFCNRENIKIIGKIFHGTLHEKKLSGKCTIINGLY